MKIHEYQAKQILRGFGVNTPRGIGCFSVEEAVEAARKLGGGVWAVSPDSRGGARQGGGRKVARSLER